MHVEKFNFGLEINAIFWYKYFKLCINIGWFVTPLYIIVAAQTQLIECYTNIINDFHVEPDDVLFPEIISSCS